MAGLKKDAAYFHPSVIKEGRIITEIILTKWGTTNMVGRIFLCLIALIMLAFYFVAGVYILDCNQINIGTPMLFFSMIPTWPISLMVYALCVDPLSVLKVVGALVGFCFAVGFVSALISGGHMPRYSVTHVFHHFH